MPRATAQLDLDASGVKTGSRQAIDAFNAVIERDRAMKAQIMNAPQGETGAERLFRSERRAHTEALGAIRQFASGASATDVVSDGLIRATEAFRGVGLGTGVAAAAIATYAMKIAEAAKETNELREATEKAQIAVSRGTLTQTASQVAQTVDATTAAHEKDMASLSSQTAGITPDLGAGPNGVGGNSGFWSMLGATVMRGAVYPFESNINAQERMRRLRDLTIFGGMRGFGEANDEYFKGVDERTEQAKKARDQAITKFRDSELIPAQVESHTSTEQAALMRNRVATYEQIGDLYRTNPGLAEEIKKLGGMRAEDIQRKFGDIHRGQEHAIRLSNIQRDTGAAPDAAARENLQFARQEFELSKSRSQEEQTAARAKLASARAAFDVSRRESQESQIQYDSDSRLAQLRKGSGDDELAALQEQVTRAKSLVDVYSNVTEQRQRQLDIAKAQQAYDNAVYDRTAGQRTLDLQRAQQDADDRLASPSEKARIALEFAQKELEAKKGASKQEQEAAQIKRDAAKASLWQAEREEEITRRTSEVETHALKLRIEGRNRIADVLSRHANDQKAYDEAIMAGRPDLAGQIYRRSRLQDRANNFDQAYNPETHHSWDLASQEGARRQRNEQNRRAAELKRFMDRGGMSNVDRDSNGNVVGGWDPSLGEHVKRGGDGKWYDIDSSGKWSLDEARNHIKGNAHGRAAHEGSRIQADAEDRAGSREKGSSHDEHLSRLVDKITAVHSILSSWDK
jgi:hypothetical protein